MNYKKPFVDMLEETPIIAAVKDYEGLERAVKSDIGIIFILFGDICSIADIVDKIKDSGKIAMIHMDLLGGVSAKEVAVDFIARNTKADGIITTKCALVKYAKQLGLYTVLRYFVLDSKALSNIEKQDYSVQPDVIEILPGVMPKIIRKVRDISRVPVIAGGLISDREDVMDALSHGAMAVSATSENVWFM